MKSGYVLFVFLLIPLLAVMGCEGDEGPAGPAGEAGAQSCGGCHNSTNLISGIAIQWEESAHGMGEAYVRGTRSSCAACHSGNAFAEAVAAGLAPDELTAGDPNPTRQDCRACHMIHDTYTLADFGLRTTAAVNFYADNAVTYDGGLGNLCVNCHQPRRVIPEAVGGVISGISTHWGPHHGPQSAMLLGTGGAGTTVGTPATHYTGVDDTCVNCHMGDGREHYFEPDTDACTPCHGEQDNFDIDGAQTEIQNLANQLGDLLVDANLINVNSEDGHPIVTEAPEAQAIALWNWLYVAHEDKSLGAHNPNYAKALLEESLTLMQP
jgi:hypothetical protein